MSLYQAWLLCFVALLPAALYVGLHVSEARRRRAAPRIGMSRKIQVMKGPIILNQARLEKCEMTAGDALTEMLEQDQRMVYDTGSLAKVVLCAIEALVPASSRPNSPPAKMGDSSAPSEGLG